MDKNKKLFPQRLWELIHDDKYNFCLRWSQDGQRVYLNRNEFETHYLKTPSNQFHTQKAISFVRQMNMYGFRKVDDCFYENDNFKRNCLHLLKNMIRKHSNRSYFSSPPSSVGPSHHLSLHSHHPPYPTVSHQQQQQLPIPSFIHQPASSLAGAHSLSLGKLASQQISQASQNKPTTAMRRIHQHLHNQQHQHLQDSTLATSLQQQHQSQHHQQQQPQDSSPDNTLQSCFQAAEVARSMDNLSAAMASQTPLASSLYYRLAALNFNSNSQHQTSGQQMPSTIEQQQQQQQLISQLMQERQMVASTTNNPNSLLARPTSTCLEQSDLNQRLAALQQLPHQNQLANRQFSQLDSFLDSPGSIGVGLSAAEQVALQENLVRTFLQLHTRQNQEQQRQQTSINNNNNNQLPQHLQDKAFLLRTLQDQSLLESLATMSSGEPPPSAPQPQTASQASSPLELVVRKRSTGLVDLVILSNLASSRFFLSSNSSASYNYGSDQEC